MNNETIPVCKRISWGLLISFWLVISTPASSADNSTIQVRFEQANRLYMSGQYAKAIEAYQFVLSQVPNGYVYYNLGNAYFRQGKRGQAIWCYERALRFLPRDTDVQANLDYANSLNEDRFEYPVHPLSLAQLYNRFTIHEWTFAYIVTYCLIAACGIAYFLLDHARQWLRRLGLMCSLFLLFSLLCLGLRWRDMNTSYAIVTQSSVEVHNGPGKQFESLFLLHEGAKVESLRTTEEWLEISTPDNRRGWLSYRSVANI